MEEATAGSGKMLRLALAGLAVLLIALAGIAVMFFLKNSNLQEALADKDSETAKVQEAAAAAEKQVKQVQGDLKAANDRIAELELERTKAERLKMLVAKVEPQLDAWLEAASQTKGAKPEARAAALTIVGLLGQVTRGTNNAAALATLDRALAIDKTNCIAGLALNASGVRSFKVAPECAALLPAETPPAAAKEDKAAASREEKSAAAPKDEAPAAGKKPAH